MRKATGTPLWPKRPKLSPPALLIRREHILYTQSKQPGGPECEREARIVTTGLHGVHSLPGNSEFLGQLSLTPVSFRSKNAKAVRHS